MRRMKIQRERLSQMLVNFAPPAEEAIAWLAPHLDNGESALAHALLKGEVTRALAYDHVSYEGPLWPAIILSYAKEERQRAVSAAFIRKPRARFREGLRNRQALYVCVPFLLVALAAAFFPARRNGIPQGDPGESTDT
ncbi:MAG: hypothetical protein ACI8W8_001767 [Rhodothermales bacterium]|jgi:hypothetical protein